ncbi:SAM-dependent methyltransferase [Oceanibacterium hippocampi]|uniref:Cyclopropane-fatty-acyl-phospholipid synthase n=1 Tax=Oceanibacterium hippocampi TaxID=745714 RepID=A0A1Y5TUD9_9PROT|nr:cyclopropane-fatty-acyl-phospholipid synthase family protein [Oceanibacterium hippocampi]SLN73044.1 Cyclopropane-fatty-acyl-phospholipid synthase [Oceanibacterium hippocampi]
MTASSYLLDRLGSRIRCGSLRVRLPDGSWRRFEGAEPGPGATLHIDSPRFYRRLMSGGSVGFAEAYIARECDTPDLRALLDLLARNMGGWRDEMEGSRLYRVGRWIYHALHANTPRGARRNIRAHYDLGNEFYRRWLDDSMTYSSAVFEAPDMALGDAQAAKYRRIAEAADIRDGHHVLEIGCGWGGFAEFAASRIGARITAITISDAQYEYAAERIFRAGLNERVAVEKRDYRDVEGAYDRIASIEMFEAVGEAYWPQFFDKMRMSLRPGGRAAMQVITIADHLYDGYRKGTDFVQRHIFPGGMLPSPAAIRAEVARAGLSYVGDSGFAHDYAATLAQWSGRFERAWPELLAMGFDERFRRLWRYYLAYCEAGFRNGRIDVRQIALGRP